MSSSLFKIFIVEDDKIFAKILKHHLSLNPDYQVEIFNNGQDFLDNLYKKPDMVSLDNNLPGLSGIEILEKVKKIYPDLPIVIVSGQDDIQTAIDLLQKGVYDYIIKNEDTKERLWNITIKIREKLALQNHIDILEQEIEKQYSYNNLIKGNSKEINNIFRLIDKAVKTNITVSISGETGTGKELVAKSIHYNSKRRKKPFVAINVSAVPRELIESEFFGHEKGAFTGATNNRIGKFEQANGGTLFLDEVGDMDINMQSKLLRVLQEGEFVRIGSNTVIKTDVRIISATHKNLEELVKTGAFREDLYYRLLGLPINIPPLRNRGNDIIILAKYFLQKFCKNNDMKLKVFSKQALEKLKHYPFPGNVRELKAIIDLSVVMADTNEITENDIIFSGSSTMSNLLQQEKTLADYDKMIIKYFLKKYNNKVRLVADKLNIGKTTIYRLLKEEIK